MSVQIVSPGLTLANRRSAPRAAGTEVLTGRWVALNSTGYVVPAGSASRLSLQLALEGTLKHTGGPTDFGAATPFASTKYASLPSAQANGEIALVRGSFVYETGPEGCDPAAAAGLTVGAEVAVDADGRIVPIGAAPADVAIGTIEARTLDGAGKITKLRISVK